MGFEIKGFDEVKKNLAKEIAKIKRDSMNGLKESAILVRFDMDKKSPLIPIDTGNLRQSWFITPLDAQLALIMGFSANYAVFVHEMIGDAGKKINWNRPGSGAKFFEASLKRNTNNILKILAKNTKIK